MNQPSRKNICSLINCQKLTSEACAHAAQNERLSAETRVQVLYHEQQRLKETIHGPNQLPSDQHRRSFMSSLSKKFVKLTPFLWVDHGVSPLIENKNKRRPKL